MIPIYFDDLNEKGEKKILEFLKVEKLEKDSTVNIFPLYILIHESEVKGKGGGEE